MLFRKLAVFFMLFPCFAEETISKTPMNVAVASNFVATMQTITKAYTEKTGQAINVLAGATGKHYLQIINGAPIDIFFAADQKRPNELLKNGKASVVSTYAVGRLVYWMPAYSGEAITFEEAIRLPVQHIALANPSHAPYGLAAQQTLQKLSRWDDKEHQQLYVFAENIGQSYHLVQSKAVTAGFVAYSQINKSAPPKTTFWLVPEHYYQAIKQDLAIIKPSQTTSDFMAYFNSPEVQAMIITDGYQLPGHSTPSLAADDD